MTETEAKGRPEVRALAVRLAAARDLLERARQALAEGELPDLDRLAALLGGLGGELGDLSRVDHGLRGPLLALLDEADRLTGTLRAEQARLAVQLRAAGAHRRAGVAYRRAGKL